MRKFLHAACQCAMLAVLARCASPEIVGQYALGIALSAPILVLAQFRRHEPGAADIRITSLALSLIGIAAIGFLGADLQDRLAILLAILNESVEWIANLYSGRRSQTSQLLHGVLPLPAVAFSLHLTGHLGFALLAALVIKLAVLFGYDFRLPRSARPAGDRESSVARLAAIVPCYFIAHMLGFRSLGLFAAIQAFAPMTDAAVRILGEHTTPPVARAYDDADSPAFSHLSLQIGRLGVMLALCSVAAAAILGPWLLSRTFGPAFAAQPALIVAIAGASGAACLATLLGLVLAAARRGADRIPLEIVSVAATSVGCLALVARFGLLGAACAAGFGSLIQITGEITILRAIHQQPRGAALVALLKAPLV